MLKNSSIRKNPEKTDKIKQIQNKITHISQKKIDTAKEERYNDAANKISMIQQTSLSCIKNYETNVKKMRQSLNELQRKYEQSQLQFTSSLNNRTKQIDQIQKKLQGMLFNLIHKSKENERKIVKISEQRASALFQLLAKQIQIRKSFFNKLDEDLSISLPDLSEDIKKQLYINFVKIKTIEQKLNKEIQDMFQEINENKKKQQENFEGFLNMVAQIIESVKEQITIEKQNRINCKQKLLKLFEGAYTQLVQK